MALGHKTLDDLLNPISKQLGHAKVAQHVGLPKWDFKPARVTDGLSHDQLVNMFVDEAEKVRVQVKRCSRADLAATIAEIAGQGEPDTGAACSVVCAADDRFEQAGVYDALNAQDAVTKVSVWDEARGQENVDDAAVATYGVTYATGGIAETATIVQPTSASCGRAISLLPLVHIAVVDADAIVPTMGEIMAGYEGQKLPSQVCFISGPSATADIELVRVEGVHGPMYVHYVIVE
ncbi:MAG TPA: hypothetical protein DCP91_02480 [Eggerthellaceae bacterium]|nr:hypothetical protein [Eggerthellaceae bacterium]